MEIYANLDWLNNKTNDSKLDKFDKRIAQCTYKKTIWNIAIFISRINFWNKRLCRFKLFFKRL